MSRMSCSRSPTETEPAKKNVLERFDFRVHGTLFLVSVCAHGLFVASLLREDPLAISPIMDSAYYLELARHWLSGNISPPDHGLFLLAPGYALFLTPVLALVGEAIWLVLIIQALAAALGLVLLTLLAESFTCRRTALAAALLLLLYGPHQLFVASFLSEALIVPVVAAFFLLFDARRYPPLQVALLGFAYLLRPNLGLFLLALLTWSAVRERSRLRHLSWTLVFIVAIPVFHWFSAGRPWAGSAQVGTALYLGNHPGSQGLFDNDIGVRGTIHEMADQVVAAARRRSGRELSLEEVDQYWKNEVKEWMFEDPAAFANNVALKLLRLVDTHEYATDHQWVSDFPSAARLFSAPYAVLIACAAGGLVAARGRHFEPLLLYLVCGTAGLLLFYPSSRHRYVLVPVLMVLTARGLEAFRSRRPAALLLATFVFALSMIGVRDEHRANDPFSNFNRSRAAAANGDLATSRHFLDLALAQRPDVGFFHVQRAELLAAEERSQEARVALRVAYLFGERDPELVNRVAADAIQHRQWSFAETVFRDSVFRYPLSSATHMNLAQVLLAQGRIAEARASYEKAVALGSLARPDLEYLLTGPRVRVSGTALPIY